MRRSLFLLALIPAVALALDYTDRSSQYTDAPFSKPEAVAISILTNLGVVQGNPDGTFAPQRALNRAEFMKIAFKGVSTIAVASNDAADCFPDVRAADWFSPFVCLAQKRGVVQGYPDGKFHPERVVNYAEALKILTGLFEYTFTEEVGDQWFDPYVRAARAKTTLLPISIELGTPLTRGQMARLMAGFIAESQGALAEYRAREQGQTLSSSSVTSSAVSSVSSASSTSSSSSVSSAASASSVSSAASTSSVSSSSSVSSASSASSLANFPARSHFIVLGSWSDPIASANFRASLEPVIVLMAEVKMKTEIKSLQYMEVVDGNGSILGALSLDPYDSNDLTWKGTFSRSGATQILKDEERVLGVRVKMKSREDGGQTEQMVQVDTFRITVEGVYSGTSYNSAPPTFSFPKHQTTMARILSVRNALPAQGILPVGSHQLLASFELRGESVTGATLRAESMEFQVTKSSTIAVSGWELRSTEGDERVLCSVSDSIVSCLMFPVELGSFINGSRTFRVYGDVAIDQGAQYPSLQVDLNLPGTLGENGAIRWTDGSGHFNWVELSTPIASGTRWQG